MNNGLEIIEKLAEKVNGEATYFDGELLCYTLTIAKLEQLRKEIIIDLLKDFQEINPNNYTHDDVVTMNDYVINLADRGTK